MKIGCVEAVRGEGGSEEHHDVDLVDPEDQVARLRNRFGVA
jgi:hypothetical protein